MMNNVNMMLSFSDIKKDTQETFNESVNELVSIVKRHNEWIGTIFALVSGKNGNIEEKPIFQIFYEYNEETEVDELILWYDDELVKKVDISKPKID